MILIYTGNGKGKTSACIGQVIRAMGNNMPVAFAQFLKRDGQAGEQAFLRELLGPLFHAKGKGFFFKNQKNVDQHRAAAYEVVGWALEVVEKVTVLILDESLYALNAGLITAEELKKIINACTEKETHLILSGRDAPDWLIRAADTVTEMVSVKHAFSKGVPAQKGIDF